jgi:hypothetical protein
LCSGWGATGSVKDPRLLLEAGEDAEHSAHSLELGRRLIPKHVRDAAIGGQESAVVLKETETYWRAIHQRVQQGLCITKGIFYSPASYHGILEIQDLLAQASNLMDQLMPGPLLVSHGNM